MSNLFRPWIVTGTYPMSMVKDDISPERAGFGMRLKAAREAVEPKISQEDVAKRFSINKATVSAWETGRGDPGVYRLRELSKLYKTSSESLLWENAPSNEAMQIAASFDGLSPRRQQTFHTLWLAFLQDAKSDADVEDAMPVTKTKLEPKRIALPPALQEARKKDKTKAD